MIGFPQDPEDGEIYQVNDILIYQYNAGTGCWARLTGIDNLGLATASQPGLMSPEEFQKVEEIILPSFDTTVTSQECDTKFTEGKVDLISSNADVDIAEKLELYNPDGTTQDSEFVIHNNTAGVDFRVNLPTLIDEMQQRDNFKVEQVSGPQGKKGPKGKPGEDKLDTGPTGSEGPAGLNAPFGGSIIEDQNEAVSANRAVVDVQNDEENPRRIRVTIGRIGDPGVGPKNVSWKNKNTPWVMGLSSLAFDCGAPRECVPASSVTYVDMMPILDKIEEKFDDAITKMKEEKEEIAKQGINSIASLFQAQRQALCCALETAMSKRTNQNIRNIMSNGRYQAAQAGYAFSFSGVPEDHQIYQRSGSRQFPGEFLPKPDRLPSDNVIINGDTENPIQFTCLDCFVEIQLDQTNVGRDRSVTVDLAAYDYVFTVTDCCLYRDGVGGTGEFVVVYQDLDGNRTVVSLPSRGFFPAKEDREQYIGESLSIRHNGGPIQVFLPSYPAISSNYHVTVCIQPTHCFQTRTCLSTNPAECDENFFLFGEYPGRSMSHLLGDAPGDVAIVYDFFTRESSLNVYHPPFESPGNLVASTGVTLGSGVISFTYEDIEEKTDQILVVVKTDDKNAQFTYSVACSSDITGLIPPNSQTAPIFTSHAEFYQRGWRNGTSCGALVELEGVLWIVSYRSIGTDCSCGGNEYEETPFIEKFGARFGRQPALAWPTIDGETFFGLPDDPNYKLDLIYDKDISDELEDKIRSGDVIRSQGDQSVLAVMVSPALI